MGDKREKEQAFENFTHLSHQTSNGRITTIEYIYFNKNIRGVVEIIFSIPNQEKYG